MPEESRISVHDYIDARLDEQDERIRNQLLIQDDRIEQRHMETRFELRELIGWFLFLSAPTWTDLLKEVSKVSNEVAITIGILIGLIGLLLVAFYRMRRPNAVVAK